MDSNSGVTYACLCKGWVGPWEKMAARREGDGSEVVGRCPNCEQRIYEDMAQEKPSLIQHYEAREREMKRFDMNGTTVTAKEGGSTEAWAKREDFPEIKDPRLGSTQNVLRSLTEDSEERKGAPITTGVIDYFPLALVEIARLSQAGNDKHNPGQPLHWARGKSSDHADCLVRHLIQRGEIDTDGISHTAKVAWRALALLQEEMEARQGFNP